MDKELDNIQLRSEEVQEILGHIPSRIIRYGIGVIISVILVLFAGSFFFKYPDILTAPVEVVSENPPAAIVAKVSGNLTSVFVSDSQEVKQNQKLAVIKNPAQFNHVEWLKLRLQTQSLMVEDITEQYLVQWPDSLVLGDIQTVYASFLKAAKDYLQFRQLNYYPEKIASLQKKQIELEKYAQIMEQQVNLKKQDFELAQNQFLRDSGLYVKQVISLSDFEKGRQSLLQNSLSVENAKSVVVNTRIQLQDLQQQISDLRAEKIRQNQNHENVVAELLINLENSITTWYDMYVLVSPIDGITAFNKIWSNNQFVQAGEQVFTIIPSQRSRIIGRINLAAKGAGKVKTNQDVNLKFENFPYQEFGMITASVSTISLVPTEQNYMVEIKLPDTLITNYGYLLPFSQKMLGTAEIITEDLPLIVRLFNPLKSIIKKHWTTQNVKKIEKNKNDNRATNNVITKNIVAETMVTESDSIAEKYTSNRDDSIKSEYYIIAGSFLDDTKAKKALINFESKGYSCTIIESNGRFRLAIYKSNSGEQAFKQLEIIRKAEGNENIWVLKVP